MSQTDVSVNKVNYITAIKEISHIQLNTNSDILFAITSPKKSFKTSCCIHKLNYTRTWEVNSYTAFSIVLL